MGGGGGGKVINDEDKGEYVKSAVHGDMVRMIRTTTKGERRSESTGEKGGVGVWRREKRRGEYRGERRKVWGRDGGIHGEERKGSMGGGSTGLRGENGGERRKSMEREKREYWGKGEWSMGVREGEWGSEGGRVWG